MNDWSESEVEEDFEFGPSKTRIKKEMLALQQLGLDMLVLDKASLEQLPMQDALRDALEELRQIKANSARKRQMKFVGKLLRQEEDIEPYQQALAKLRQGAAQDAELQHSAEHWRDRLLNEAEALEDWCQSHPQSANKAFRSLVKTARAEHAAAQAALERGGKPKKGRSFRQLFRTVRDVLDEQAGAHGEPGESD